MKVGIVGDTKRAVAWEQHLRPHHIVRQVDLTPHLNDLNEVDACFILDNSPENLDHLLEGIHRGFNCFLVSRQPTDRIKLEKIHSSAKEAGTLVQFSHWPTLAPATQWMMDKMNRPGFIHIDKEINRNYLIETRQEFKHLWIDELGLCLKWIDSSVHHIEAKEIRLEDDEPVIMHLFLRFDNGATATVNLYAGAAEDRHVRLISNKKEIFECTVPTQTVRTGKLSTDKRLFFDKHTFDPSKSAEKAALLFLKSVQINKTTAYTSYDALQLATQIEKVEQRLKQF